MPEIRTLRAMWRGLETSSRFAKNLPRFVAGIKRARVTICQSFVTPQRIAAEFFRKLVSQDVV